MLLSLAMATGRVLMDQWDHKTFCGCAIAAGLKGTGKAPGKAYFSFVISPVSPDTFHCTSETWKNQAIEEWPWLEGEREIPPAVMHHFDGEAHSEPLYIISRMFDEVVAGKLSFDQIIDWTRENEPPELVEMESVHSEQAQLTVR